MAIVALVLLPFPRLQLLTAANMLLVVVLLIAITWGRAQAFCASVLAALCLNYFFVSRAGSFDLRIDGSADEIALLTFLFTAIAVGKPSSQAQSRAREDAEMYEQLCASFHRASELEAIRRAERFKTALLDTVTHDLRTPLTSIKAAADKLVAARRNEPETVPRRVASEDTLLNIIVQQSARLNHFFEGMIELAKAESAQPAALQDIEPVLLEEIITATVARQKTRCASTRSAWNEPRIFMLR